jgi:vacuolar protein sorting-associated protein 1
MVIEKAIVNLEGINISGFPSIDLFVYLLTPQLEKLREPALDLVQDVYANLEFMTYNIIDKIFMRFPTLKPEIIDIVNTIIQEERDHCREIVAAVVEAEENYIFTNDVEFKENKSAEEREAERRQNQPQDPNARNAPPQMPKQAAFLKNIRDRIDNYFRIVLRNCRDTVPKQVGYFLVQKSQDKLNKDLWMRINSNQRISNMLGEPPSVTERRKNLKNTIDTMRQSLKVLQRDPE